MHLAVGSALSRSVSTLYSLVFKSALKCLGKHLDFYYFHWNPTVSVWEVEVGQRSKASFLQDHAEDAQRMRA